MAIPSLDPSKSGLPTGIERSKYFASFGEHIDGARRTPCPGRFLPAGRKSAQKDSCTIMCISIPPNCSTTPQSGSAPPVVWEKLDRLRVDARRL